MLLMYDGDVEGEDSTKYLYGLHLLGFVFWYRMHIMVLSYDILCDLHSVLLWY